MPTGIAPSQSGSIAAKPASKRVRGFAAGERCAIGGGSGMCRSGRGRRHSATLAAGSEGVFVSEVEISRLGAKDPAGETPRLALTPPPGGLLLRGLRRQAG